MKLDRLQVQGFKSLHAVDIQLGNLNVLIGANGAGKSNFIALFRLLHEMVEGRFQLSVAQAGGASVFLHAGPEPAERIRLMLAFGPNAYTCNWVPTSDDRLIFEREVVFFSGDFADTKRELGSGQRESLLRQVNPGGYTVESYVYNSLRSWHVYHFHDTSDSAAVKRAGDINDDLELHTDAANLAAFLRRLELKAPSNYQAIRSTVRRVAPFFDDFLLRPTTHNEDRIRLEWRSFGSSRPFLASQLSDGTLRFICLVTVLLQPKLPDVILIDEPELGLHPYAIELLAGLMRSVSTRTQLIVSTQSVPLVNQILPEDVIVVDRQGPESVLRRLRSEDLAGWLEDYSLGELWEKNVLGGRPFPNPLLPSSPRSDE
ncbi:AAA family ATPase [Deinococcus aestuarii]|uniref:AAA family ATPase n=1 Tax=Deinococcus aestuarii TaxID=2774531 RepID=UPI001C0AB7B3|nr:AAA family ATPase [Deinococcus aestuarii]